jgi:hypothetical protein
METLEFFKNHKKRPSNKTNKILTKWLSHQIQNYKKVIGLMKDEHKREKIKKLCKTYDIEL